MTILLKTMPLAHKPPQTSRICSGTPAFRRTCIALFMGGFSTFWLMYWVQPLMPLFSRVFSLSPSTSSLSLSVSTGGVAIFLLPASFISDRFGRRPVMCIAMVLAAVLTLLVAFVPDFFSLLVLRAMAGVVFAGLPAVAMAYLSEEIDPLSLGTSMGLYISGAGLGGMGGRLVTASVSSYLSWRWAAGVIGFAGLVSAYVFWRCLPKSRYFVPRQLPFSVSGCRALWAEFLKQIKDEGLPWLFASGFFLMGSFVSLYNYIGYRLEAPPFSLNPRTISTIFLLYLVGSVASTWAGRQAERIGWRNMLWRLMALMLAGLLLTLFNRLPLIILGIALFTFAFFGAHSVVSSWVGRRAGSAKALGASLYLSCYYLGSSVVGSITGLFWAMDQWLGVCAALFLVVSGSLAIAWHLRKLPPKQMSAEEQR